MNLDHLQWPFFDASHRRLGAQLHRIARKLRSRVREGNR